MEFKIKLIQAERDVDYLLDEIDRLQGELRISKKNENAVEEELKYQTERSDRLDRELQSARQEINAQNTEILALVLQQQKLIEGLREIQQISYVGESNIKLDQCYSTAKHVLRELGVTEQ